MSELKLAPCPFCGGEAEVIGPIKVESDWWCASVICLGGDGGRKCSVQMSCGAPNAGLAVVEVVRAWNGRDD